MTPSQYADARFLVDMATIAAIYEHAPISWIDAAWA